MPDWDMENGGSTTASGGNPSSITSLDPGYTKQNLVEQTLRKSIDKQSVPRHLIVPGKHFYLPRSPLPGLDSTEKTDSESDSETDDISDEERIEYQVKGGEEGGTREDDPPVVLDPIKLIERTPSQWPEEDHAFCKAANAVIEHPEHGERLLMVLLDYLSPGVPESDQANYLRLAQYIVKKKPSLLSTVSMVEKMSPLHVAIQKSLGSPRSSVIMQDFIKGVCDEASAQGASPKEPLNPCQQAIDQGPDGETCLYFALANSLEVAGYLVEKASIDTLLKPCGPKRQTVLHLALHKFVEDKRRPGRMELISAIVEKAPAILLEVNCEGLSPYRYFERLRKGRKQLFKVRNFADVDGQKALLVPTSSRAELQRPQAQAEKDRWKARGSAHQPDSNSVRGGGNDSIGIAHPRVLSKTTQRGGRSQGRTKKIAELLKEKCLEYNTFSDTLKALYGSMEGNDATWLNLLGTELPVDFRTKLQFRSLEPRMVLVALRVPKGGGQRDSSGPSTSNRILEFFNWLRNTQKVESIMKVIVRDDSLNPSGDQVIQAALERFDVQYLDWDRVDISCKTLAKACPRLRELRLNCSGNSAVLNGWADERGLKSLKKLKTVTVFVSQGWDNVDHTNSNLEHLKSVFENIREVNTLSYPANLFRKNYDRSSPTVPVAALSTKDHKWLSLTREFTEGLADAGGVLAAESLPRVCIIDDGASLYDQYVIKSGRSFGQHINHSSNPGECFPSVDGHGASMARIIYNLCPCIDLYVAKLERTGGRGKFTMSDAQKAISWAIDQKVDVISMSWTLDKANERDVEDLEGLFKRLANVPNCPAMFCASRDQGSDQKDAEVYPFRCAKHSVCNIGAANEYGTALPQTPDDATYLFPCHGLDMWGPSDHRVRAVIEGSSDATALAAGLAALILACEGAVHGRQGIEFMRTLPNMKILFNTMRRDGGRYIKPRLFDRIMKDFKVMAASPEHRNSPIKPEDAMLWRMREVSNSCHSAIYAQGGGKCALWTLGGNGS